MKTVILAGGSGTRLWPLSRKLYPKQFIKLFDENSLFQLTLKRNLNISSSFTIISNENHYFLALDQIEELTTHYPLPTTNYILEPFGKNTAPAIAFACFNSDEDDILFITPSDHLIEDEDKYLKAIESAKKEAENGSIVTFGINPTTPHTGYGYIESEKFQDGNIFNVVKFHEKPNLDIAKEYLQKGNYFWNSGMFMFKAGVYLEELKKYAPDIYESSLEACKSTKRDGNVIRIREKYMEEIREESIDYAVLERSDKIKVIKSEFRWNDVGSFDSLIEEIESDEIIEVEARNNFLISKNHVLDKKVAIVGVDDLIVVDTPDSLLITKKAKTQKVKEVVNILKEIDKEKTEYHTKVYRPWGSYEVLVDEDKYKLKRIIVKPGKRLSLQKHFHRNEHWIVVSGTAEVQVGEKMFIIRPNESTYIKMGEIHRLSNPGKIPVVLIEAQVGEYTGEDDIIRLADDFNRK